ncbi:MAG: hypothetical protein RXR20_22375, partial [Paraburkholderia sp.]|jgi:hypothetical protein|uniref:hypothetical protein n=1 Tax=Burkholderiaceae TaxID=119060 RepID=UPI0010F5B77A|nr:hypothetical protein [Burkholderia sp. 4M9327F10]
MSITTMLLRRLTGRQGAGSDHPRPEATHARAPGHDLPLLPLQWRKPWRAWQFLSWIAGTLLAPTFCVTGVLLTINSNSDSPLFWPCVMAIVAVTNAMGIVHTNQRHHRRPFTGRNRLALHYLGVTMLLGCTLFLLLALGTGILQDFMGLLTANRDAAGPSAITALWTAALTAGFGLLSFVPASVLHAWLAFEALGA